MDTLAGDARGCQRCQRCAPQRHVSDGIGQGPGEDPAAGLLRRKALSTGASVSTLWARKGQERGAEGSGRGVVTQPHWVGEGPICRGPGAEGPPRGPGVRGRVLPSVSTLGHVCSLGLAVGKQEPDADGKSDDTLGPGDTSVALPPRL